MGDERVAVRRVHGVAYRRGWLFMILQPSGENSEAFAVEIHSSASLGHPARLLWDVFAL